MLDDDDVAYYEFAGRILALGIRLKIPLGVHLSSACIRAMTYREVTLQDLQGIEPEMATTYRYNISFSARAPSHA